MNGIIIYYISNAILNVFCLYFCYNLSDKEFKLNSVKNISIVTIMTIVASLLNWICPRQFKFILSFVFLISVNFIAINKNIIKSMIIVIIMEIELFILDMTFYIIASVLIKNNIMLMSIISNIYVTTVGILLIKSKISNKIYFFVLKIINSIKTKSIALYSLMIIFILIFSTIESYTNLPIQIIILANTIIALIFIAIIVKFVATKNNYFNISNQYQTSIASLKEYEAMIDKYRITNHENKNELMTIRNMIKSKDRATIEYIDKLVDNKIKDNEKILYKTSKIPEGGLRAIIYSKLTLMDKYKIKYTLDIANDVRTVDLINLGDDLILDICKILGVFLDNSIDAVRKLKKKNINIEFYMMDSYLNVDITNNFKGNLDLNKLGTKKYTTKGEGHGYGLSLVNQIISENSNVLENEKSINGDLFTQTLKIKM